MTTGQRDTARDGGDLRPLANVVGPGMRLLLVGLNPSPTSAATGVAFAHKGNRFWPAALQAGIVTSDRDPLDALETHGVGFTDLVERVTARANELAAHEYITGAARLHDLLVDANPKAVCFVGLTGYRIAIDKHATVGWQPLPFAGVATYVMPNPSGLNARTNVADLAAHLANAYGTAC